jgi:hypothetical protein
MRKFLVVATLLALMPAMSWSQETPKAELFGGYGFSRIEGSSFNGWTVNLAGNVNPNLGIVAEAHGGYNSKSSDTVFGQTESKTSVHSFLVGPRVSDRHNKVFTPFAHLLMGYSRVNNDVTITSGSVSNSSSGGVNGFGLVAGGGIDIGGSSSLSYRLVQVDYLMIRSQNDKPQGVRLSTGLVLRLGKRPQ